MIPLLLIVIAIISYILGSLSTPLLMAKYIFHKDITPRRGIVGYNTFARHFGTKWALLMVVADIVKCAAAVFIGGLLLSIPGEGFPVIGRLFACFCLVLGDIFPAQRHYRGGKGVICLFTALWVADWRVGLFVTGVFIAVLALSQFMSLASLAGCLTGILASWVLVPAEQCKGLAGTLVLFSTLFIVWRHRGNIAKLLQHKEKKMNWGRAPESRLREDRF